MKVNRTIFVVVVENNTKFCENYLLDNIFGEPSMGIVIFTIKKLAPRYF